MNVKASSVVVGLVLAGAVGGLIVGTRGTRVTTEARRQTALQRAEHGAEMHAVATGVRSSVAPAVAWRDLPGSHRGPNGTFVNALAKLGAASVTPEVLDGRDARLAVTLEARAERRAFDGAPPRIPHAYDERSTTSCVACHLDGQVVVGHTAPRMSHPLYQNCTQCHVSLDKPVITRSEMPADNDFIGLKPHAGTRFMPDAPPVMPHVQAMRQTCLSCHGPLGPAGLRSTHPERANCTQCHVAERNGLVAPSVGPWPHTFEEPTP